MSIYLPTAENIASAAKLIQQGELVAFATETVYGLGANALNAEACEKIFKAKNRPHFDPLIVHIHSLEQLSELTEDIPEKTLKILNHFWPGPLTAVLKKKLIVPDIVTAGLPNVAVRFPKHPLALSLLRAANLPIAAPSANPFGYLSPTTAKHVEEQLGNKVSFILDGGECDCGVESTIIDFTKEVPELLRHGGIPREEIEKICGEINLGKAVLEKPLAPGQLASHYAPATKLVILSKNELPKEGLRYGFLNCGEMPQGINPAVVEQLSLKGDLAEAAHNLFSALHRLDELKLEVIYVYELEENGIGAAIMDRLRKAAVKLH